MGWAGEVHNLGGIRQVKQYDSKVLSVLRSRDLSYIEANSLWAFYLAVDVWSRATDGCSFGYCRLFQMEGARIPNLRRVQIITQHILVFTQRSGSTCSEPFTIILKRSQKRSIAIKGTCKLRASELANAVVSTQNRIYCKFRDTF